MFRKAALLTAVHMHPVPAVTATESDPPALTTDSLVGLALNVQAPLLTSLKNQLNRLLNRMEVVPIRTWSVPPMKNPFALDEASPEAVSKLRTMLALVVWPAKLRLSV